MKSIGYRLSAVFSVVVLINNANAEAWGKFENDSLRIERESIKQEVISDDLFDETIKDELASVKKIEDSKKTKSNKNSKKSKPKSRKKSKKKR
jgi:hypothetical protein